MPRLSKEDWVCSDPKCKNVNFSKRDKCNRCGIPRKYSHSRKGATEIGKQLAGKSKGLFSPEDWVCKTCGNINWARRNTCNVCNGPKFDTQGERTGYGGGFMERDEVVEYREHGDSDDEFDEFGRKKKRFRKNQDDQNSNEMKERENGNEDQTEKIVQYDEDTQESNEENEEESGEDADLSKYDIFGIENDGDSNTQPPHSMAQPSEKAASRSSRSRSVSSSSSSSSDSNSDSSSSSSSSEGSQSSHSSSSSSNGSRNESTEKSTKESHSPRTSGKSDTSDKSLPATSKAERKKNGRQHERSRFGRTENQSNNDDAHGPPKNLVFKYLASTLTFRSGILQSPLLAS